MLTTNHLGTEAHLKVHPVVASVARELLNKSENSQDGKSNGLHLRSRAELRVRLSRGSATISSNVN
jgi:hypothetical protein